MYSTHRSYDFDDGLFGVSGGVFSGEGDEPRTLLAQATARPGTRAAVSLSATWQSRDDTATDSARSSRRRQGHAAASAGAQGQEPREPVRPGLTRLDASRVSPSTTTQFSSPPAIVEEEGLVAVPEDFKRLGLSAQGLAAVGDRTLVAAWASCFPNRHGPGGGGGGGEVGVGGGGGGHQTDWGIAATAPPTKTSYGWGVVLGRESSSRHALRLQRASPSSSTLNPKPPLQVEAFARIGGDGGLGDGNSQVILPGVVATRDADTGKWDAVVGCKVQWLFST